MRRWLQQNSELVVPTTILLLCIVALYFLYRLKVHDCDKKGGTVIGVGREWVCVDSQRRILDPP